MVLLFNIFNWVIFKFHVNFQGESDSQLHVDWPKRLRVLTLFMIIYDLNPLEVS